MGREQTLSGSRFLYKSCATQTPEYLYIGCSDSRATAEELMGAKPGEVFVTRNIANVVNTLDMSSTSVIQYAVEHFESKAHYRMWALQLWRC